MRTTLREVAEAAGVSRMAVSVVLSGTGNKRVTVSAEKAERIRQVAQELRYRPNHLARSLKSQRTNQVAVVFQHFFGVGPYMAEVLNGVTAALFPAGYAMTLCPKMILDGDTHSISDGRFDGVLWCRPDFTDACLEAIQCANVPVVMMHVPLGMSNGIPTFCADNQGAMRQVVAHLRELGHERMAFVIDPISIRSVEGQARSQAFVAAALLAGLPRPDVLVMGRDHSGLSRYLSPDRPHTALVCFSDDPARAILESCERMGISVPGQLSIVGFDSTQLCETTRPRLTSVRQPVARMAHAATTHLLSLIRESESGAPRSPMACCLYDCDLDVRESTAAPCTH